MSKATGAKRTDTASRIIRAAPHAVFDAFVDPEALIAWLAQRRSHQRYKVSTGRTGVKGYLRLNEVARKWRANRSRVTPES